MIEKDIEPVLGRRRVEDISVADVEKLHRSMKDRPIQTNRCLAILSSMLVRAEKWDLRALGSNPCQHVERYREKKRDRFLSAKEVADLGEALAEAEGDEHPSALLAIRLLALTGMRKGEVLALRWDQVDFERGLFLLPDSKTGRKAVPVGAPVLELLSKAKRVEGSPFVCWGKRVGAPLVGLQKIWERIRLKAGLKELRLHDLRHSFASFGASAGFGLFVIGRVLGHNQASTTQRYAHLGDDPLRAAADRISSEIASSLEAGASPERKTTG